MVPCLTHSASLTSMEQTMTRLKYTSPTDELECLDRDFDEPTRFEHLYHQGLAHVQRQRESDERLVENDSWLEGLPSS